MGGPTAIKIGPSSWSNYEAIKKRRKSSCKNVGPLCYSLTMKKKTKKLGMGNEARRKAESAALFQSMLKAGKHNVVTPEKYKGTRQSNKNKAIRESRNDG